MRRVWTNIWRKEESKIGEIDETPGLFVYSRILKVGLRFIFDFRTLRTTLVYFWSDEDNDLNYYHDDANFIRLPEPV